MIKLIKTSYLFSAIASTQSTPASNILLRHKHLNLLQHGALALLAHLLVLLVFEALAAGVGVHTVKVYQLPDILLAVLADVGVQLDDEVALGGLFYYLRAFRFSLATQSLPQVHQLLQLLLDGFIPLPVVALANLHNLVAGV